jgi:NAD(P)-dependent dehydrogenase (short-subunit alcohol dehydrogenase family)
MLGKQLRDHCVGRKAKGSIVNIGSMYGQVGSYPDAYTHTNPIGDASPVAYHCLKGGTIHMTRHMAVYWAADQIRASEPCAADSTFGRLP